MIRIWCISSDLETDVESGSPPVPISVEQIKQQQRKLAVEETDWTKFDYTDLGMKRWGHLAMMAWCLIFHVSIRHRVNNGPIKVDVMDKEWQKHFKHLLWLATNKFQKECVWINMSEMSEYDMDATYHEENPSTNLKKAMFWPDIISSSSESSEA